jgi:hypothetical protein
MSCSVPESEVRDEDDAYVLGVRGDKEDREDREGAGGELNAGRSECIGNNEEKEPCSNTFLSSDFILSGSGALYEVGTKGGLNMDEEAEGTVGSSEGMKDFMSSFEAASAIALDLVDLADVLLTE